MTAVCKITDGTEYVNLVGDNFYIVEWRPAGIPFKNDGNWQESVFSEGRRLTQYSIGNVSETITVAQRAHTQNDAIRQVNKLASILLSAAEYSVKPSHGRSPVYLEVKSTSESNTRYARIHAGFVGEYGNPFSQPFLQPDCASAVQDLNIIIERGPWLEVPPGSDVCQVRAPTGNRIGDTTVEYYYYDDLILREYPYAISYPPFAFYKMNETSGTNAANSSTYGSILDGTYGSATLGSGTFWSQNEPTAFFGLPNSYLDIYSADFNSLFDGDNGAMIAWVNTSGPMWTGSDAYMVRLRRSADYELNIFHDSSEGDYSITWTYRTNGYSATYTETDFDTQNEWFSVGMAWGGAVVRFYVDGKLVYTESRLSPWAGNLSSTATTIAASNTSGDNPIVSNMAYAAFWNQTLTETDMQTIGRISPPGVEIIDFEAFDCDDIVSYISNRNTYAKISHAYHYDLSLTTYSGNIVGGVYPAGILPDPIGAGDLLYLGIEINSATGLPDGPFSSVVFDISTGANAATTYTYSWEYWNGAWTDLPNVNDETDGLQNDGINSVSWRTPSDWTTTSINSVTAYWVRLSVDTVSGTWTQPIAEDDPYNATKNYVTVPANEKGGSIPAVARAAMNNTSTRNTERVVVGTKTSKIAPDFVSIINISDEQNPSGIKIPSSLLYADAAFANDTTAASGRVLSLVESSGAQTTAQDIFTININRFYASSFLGSFKAFLTYRVNTNSGASVEFVWRIGAEGYTIYLGDYINSGARTVHEIGEVSVLPDSFVGDSPRTLSFDIKSTIPTSLDVDFYELVLIPTDEWFGDFDGVPSNNFMSNTHFLSIDSTRYLNRAVVGETRGRDIDNLIGRWNQSHNGSFKLHHENAETIHFFSMTHNDTHYVTNSDSEAFVELFRNRRYNYGRGDE